MAILTILEAGTAKLADQANSNNLKKRETYVATASEPSAVARPQTWSKRLYRQLFNRGRDSRTSQRIEDKRFAWISEGVERVEDEGASCDPGPTGYEAKFIGSPLLAAGVRSASFWTAECLLWSPTMAKLQRTTGVSALEISLNGQNKGDGILYPLSKLHFDQKNHQLVLENIENRPWRLTNVR